MSDRDQRVDRLTAASRLRGESSRARAERAITRMEARGADISFTLVAKEAEVSVSYLYKVPELAARVRKLRRSAGSMAETRRRDTTASERTLRTQLAAALSRVESLKLENARLLRENQSLLARVLDRP